MEPATEPKWYRYQRTEGTRLAGPWLLSWIVSAVLLRTIALGAGPRAIVALLPLPAFVWFLWRYIRYIRSLDELRHRIELEALAIAFPLAVAFLMALGQFQLARPGAAGIPIGSGFWSYLVLFYLLGRGIAGRKYA
jgi:hypothetical protein